MLVRCSGVAVVQELRIRVIFALGDAGHQVRRGLRPREVVGQRRRDGVVRLQDRVVPAELGDDPALAGLREQQGIHLSATVAVAGEAQRPIVIG